LLTYEQLIAFPKEFPQFTARANGGPRKESATLLKFIILHG
jgi:hypothetical protein